MTPLRRWLAVVSAGYYSLFLLPHVITAWEPTWESLDSRPLPGWYDEAKFGIFLHWGVFSVPGIHDAWFWQDWKLQHEVDVEEFVNRTERPGFTYQEYAPRLNAALYQPEEWAEVFSKAGAQYVVLTSKHHEGYCMWDSREKVPTSWNWNVMDVGPKRDLLGDLAKAIKSTTSDHTELPLKFGVYHSLYEWFDPLYLQDKESEFKQSNFVDDKVMPALYDLVEKYEPEIIWSDGDWEANFDYWKPTEFLAWYATLSSVKDTGVWNDRWGKDCRCKHGSFLTCSDRYQPSSIKMHKWENAMTIDKTSWGWNRKAKYSDYLTVKELVDTLIETVALNGNMLLNAGPGPDGTLSPIFVDRLEGIGEWLEVNGEAIYKTRPWTVCQNETLVNVHYTTRPGTLYAIFTEWPNDDVLTLQMPQPTSSTRARMLGYEGNVFFDSKNPSGSQGTGISIQLPQLSPKTIPCQHAWVVALTGIANLEAGITIDDK